MNDMATTLCVPHRGCFRIDRSVAGDDGKVALAPGFCRCVLLHENRR